MSIVVAELVADMMDAALPRQRALHRPPSWGRVFAEQLSAVRQTVRPLLIAIVVVWWFYDALMIGMAVEAESLTERHLPHSTLTLRYTPESSIVVAVFALLYCLIVWLNEQPSHRAYHWMMPVGRTRHALTKFLAGLVWLLPLCVAFVVNTVLIGVVVARIQGIPALPPDVIVGARADVSSNFWYYLVPFGAASVAYMLGSAAVVCSNRPAVAIFGAPLLHVGTVLVSGGLGYQRAHDALFSVALGRYGYLAVVGNGSGGSDYMGRPVDRPFQGWSIALALWGGLALIVLLLAAVFRPKRA